MTELVDLAEFNFKVAFTVEKIESQGHHVSALDPDYVEWAAYFFDTKTENPYNKVDVHKCTEEDFSEFYPISANHRHNLDNIKKRNNFYCLSKKDKFGNDVNMTLYGNYYSGIYRNL